MFSGVTICHDGQYLYNGVAVNLNCPQLNSDNGDPHPPLQVVTVHVILIRVVRVNVMAMTPHIGVRVPVMQLVHNANIQ